MAARSADRRRHKTARMVFRACHSRVQHYMVKPMAYMLLSTGLSTKSRHLSFLLVKTLPLPREHNRKEVALQQCWSLERSLACSFWGPQTSCHDTTAQSSLALPSCRCLVYLSIFLQGPKHMARFIGQTSRPQQHNTVG